MKYFNLASVQASRVAQGCMRIGGMTASQIDTLTLGARNDTLSFILSLG